MQAVVFAIHLIVSLSLVGVILLQRSEGGALGIGGGSGGLISGRGAASVLTRTTAILAGIFFVTSLSLAAIAAVKKKNEGLKFDAVPASSSAPLTIPEAPPSLAIPAPTAEPIAPAIAPPAAAVPAAPAIPEPKKTSALDLAPKVSQAAAKPAAAVQTAPKATKPSIPEPVGEIIPAPPANVSSDSAGGEAGGAAGGPQQR